MSDYSNGAFARRRLRFAGVSLVALTLGTSAAFAQSVDVGTVEGNVAPAPRAAPANANGGLPLSSDQAIGGAAPIGSAPALAPSQASLNSFQPGSTISDKVLKDIVKPSSDYNEAAKFTPGYYSNNTNGPLGDSKSGWRGFADGQFNITFDGVPFGDANDPSHHSAAYFPGAFLGKVIVDRGPGGASQAGYASFGGTLSLYSRELSDHFGGSVEGSFGQLGTYTGAVTAQSGLVGGDTRAMVQYSYQKTDGWLQLGHVDTNNFLLKVEKKMGDVTATFFSTVGFENYNNVNSITWAQWQKYGQTYGQVNRNPATQQFVGYNNSQKRTDLEYIDLKGDMLGFHFHNKAYTYSYWYPSLQNNGADQTNETTPGTITSVTITNPASGCTGGLATCKTTIKFGGIGATDVTGYVKFNNYRAYGDLFDVSKDVNAGFASGQLRLGAWVEHVDNGRYQQYIDYTTGVNYGNLPATISSAGGATAQQQAIDLVSASFKLSLNSHITNYQPYIEYEWKPIENLSITPGFKYEAITRDHDGLVNQTTLQPVSFTHTYTKSLPFLSARYRLTPELTVYGQASQGFLIPTVSAYYVYDNAFNSNTLAPEETTNYQIGATYKSKLFTAAIDAYQITAKNFPITTTAADGSQFYVNAGTARYQGIEAEGTFAFGQLLGPGFGNGLGAYASAALSDAKFIAGPSNGFAVPNAPKYTLAGGLVYDDGTYFGSLLHKVTGDQYGSGGQVAASATVNPLLNKIAAYDSTDFVMGIRSDVLQKMGFGKKAEFKLGVSNIFDHRALTDVSGKPATLTAANPANALNYSFQAGRFIYAGLKVDF